ncbi:MAG: hypothetical protein ACI8WB_003800 [Phenylobacterium sp.]|jgi:hypothetical protein
MRGLFIGIGGTGDEVLTHLKDKIYSSLGYIPETLQFRLFDTEAEDYRKNNGARLGGDDAGAAIGQNEYVQLKDHPPGSFLETIREATEHPTSVPHVSNWCKSDLFLQNLPDADFNLVRGAGQHRQFARMGVFLNRDRIINSLRHAMEKCRSGSSGEGEIPVWILGSIAGGTGAGLFMDLALLTRWLGGDMRQHMRLIGGAILPDVYRDVGIDLARANSVLHELERFQAPVDTTEAGRKQVDGKAKNYRFSVTYDATMSVDLETKLFDNLIFYNRECNTGVERKSYFSEIADGLNLLLDDSAGDELFRQWINTVEGYAASFNTFRVFLPARLYARQFVLQGALEVAVEGLLPRNPGTQVLEFGSEDDRKNEAQKIVKEEFYHLFQDLLSPKTDDEFDKLSKLMTCSHIVNHMLGFANPASIFGEEIGDNIKRQAGQMHCNIFADIDNFRNVKEDFEDSKERVEKEVSNHRTKYWGDGETSFRVSLKAVQGMIENKIRQSIDESAKKYLSSQRIEQQALGKMVRVFNGIKNIVRQATDNLKRITAGDIAAREAALGQETDALTTMRDTSKSFMGLGGKGALADKQESYLSACGEVEFSNQREKLKLFMFELLEMANVHLNYWLDGMQHWQKTIEHIANDAQNENNEIEQRLERQTKIQSASMGLNNTVDMNGYRDFLRQKCVVNPDTGGSFLTELLSGLSWKPGDKPEDLTIEGWPDQGDVLAKDFAALLSDYLESKINQRMSVFEGMKSYLEWLRDDKRDDVRELANKMSVVSKHFLDNKLASPSRQLLFLYGDTWTSEAGKNEFTAVFNALEGDPNFNGNNIQHNLTDASGVNLFKDKNIMAILMSDCQIPYKNIRTVERMRNAYFDMRGDEDPAWRALCYHLYRCDQEAWKLEHDRVIETGESHFPTIPGTYSRLLDDPKRVSLFVKAFVCGVVRQHVEPGWDSELWVCGETDAEGKALVFLNDPDEDRDSGELLRAFITFIQDKKDRRMGIRRTITDQQVNQWIRSSLEATSQTVKQAVEAFMADNAKWFDVSHIGEGSVIEANDFLALTFNHYLKPFLK